MKKISQLLQTALLLTGFFVASLLQAPLVQAQTSEWDEPGSVCVSELDKDVATIQGLQCLIANILSVVLTIIGLVGFVMLIVGAFRWMMSGGNQQSVSKAGNTMTYAVIGLVLALSAFMILNVLAKFTGVESITKFIIPDSTVNW